MKKLAHIAPADEAHIENRGRSCWCAPEVVYPYEVGGYHEVDLYIIHSPDRKLDYRELIRKSFLSTAEKDAVGVE